MIGASSSARRCAHSFVTSLSTYMRDLSCWRDCATLPSHSVVACCAPRSPLFAATLCDGAASLPTDHVIYLPKTAGLDVLVARAKRVGRAACHASEARVIWASRAPSYQRGEPCHCCYEPGRMRQLCGMLGRTSATYPIERSGNWVCRASLRSAGRGIGACRYRVHHAIGGLWAGTATCHRMSARAAWPERQSRARAFGTSSARRTRSHAAGGPSSGAA